MIVKIEKKRDRLTNKTIYNFICQSDNRDKITYIVPARMTTQQLQFLHNYLKNCAEFTNFRNYLNTMKKYYFCSWRNGSDKEFGAIFSEETENTWEVRKSRGIQSWINIHGPFSSEKEAEIAKDELSN